MTFKKNDVKTVVKREAAIKRASERAERTPQEQLDLLDKRLGKGIGAAKERAKLLQMIQKVSS